MLSLNATTLGHQYHHRWVFRGVELAMAPGEAWVITGDNGSGKSTLLRILAGKMAPAMGEVQYRLGGKPLSPRELYRHLSWMGPQHELYDDLRLLEATQLHFRFKPCALSGGADEVLRRLDLLHHAHKPLKLLSSGLLQRARLGLALYSQTPLLILDEPTSYLDPHQAERMLTLIDEARQGRTYILASNRPEEYQQLSNRLAL
jgi:ABC-type multidrug transport system ATPase subunit